MHTDSPFGEIQSGRWRSEFSCLRNFFSVIMYEKAIGTLCGCGAKVTRCPIIEKLTLVFKVVRTLCVFVTVTSVFLTLASVHVCECN